MGKKAKVGKQRKDKYYQLAKETGYRSRAAFKLIQLNRKFGFLQTSRVCIDLCAAPGGWMQVAQQNMPLSSIVVGVDLFPIKTIPGCISLIGDITTEKCKSALSKELKTWKADIVLNDGAPNVGTNWVFDAYQQSCLTLSAMKLASSFLRKGGWFVTKIFRSKDYNSLLWVLKQLFKKVHATKPQASRAESAEIFVIGQYYIAPDKIDPKFFDPQYVFEDIVSKSKKKINILQPVKKMKKPRALGYPENSHTLYHPISVKEFLSKETTVEVLEVLQDFSEIVFDDDEVKSNPKTTPEIKECCKDIRVLGRKDLRALLTWWKALREESKQKANDTANEMGVENGDVAEKPLTTEDVEDMEDEAISKQIASLQDEESKELRRKKKKTLMQRKKLNEKMNLKMVIKGDTGPTEEADDLFKLEQVKSNQTLDKIIEQTPNMVVQSDEESDDEIIQRKKHESYNPAVSKLDSSGLFYKDSDSEIEMETESEDESNRRDGLGLSESEDEVETKNKKRSKKVSFADSVTKNSNPLLVDLDDRDAKTKEEHKAELWFKKDVFKNLEQDEDEDIEIDRIVDVYKKRGGKIIGEDSYEDNKTEKVKKNYVMNPNKDTPIEPNSDDSTSDSDYDIEKRKVKKKNKASKNYGGNDLNTDQKQDEELKSLKKFVKMDEEGLALGTLLISSQKRKRDLIDAAWNRYTFNDTNLPDWFAEDEKKHMKKDIPVPQELVNEYKKNLKEINVRPIKKVMEAKARKKKRTMRKMEKAKKKAEAVMENVDISNREKARQIKQLYKKAKTTKKKDITYIVAKKHTATKRMRRPPGVKGVYRVVDPRMKKDLRAMKSKEKTKGRKKGGLKGISKTRKTPRNKKSKSKK